MYRCFFRACTNGVDGLLPALLTEDGWLRVNAPGPSFATEETGLFVHDTKVFVKEILAEEKTPPSQGPTNYLGVFATGCDESLIVPPAGAVGPVRELCKDHCPPGSEGYPNVMAAVV
jgi:hypothetical protein